MSRAAQLLTAYGAGQCSAVLGAGMQLGGVGHLKIFRILLEIRMMMW